MKFVKMQGLGNDFVVLEGGVEPEPDLVRRFCDRHRGVGADGVLQVSGSGPVVMGYWNADGGPAEMCGNGLRCVARYAFDRGLVEAAEFIVRTPAGPRRVTAGETPRVEVGQAAIEGSFEVSGFSFVAVRVGNPHAVTVVDDVAGAPVQMLGPEVERARNANVEFARPLTGERVQMRVWERGVGETLACGSGMVAAAAALRHLGLCGKRVTVEVPGGEGLVEIEDGTTWLTGPADYVFEGVFGV
jgi:diaminopimelate epimerase